MLSTVEPIGPDQHAEWDRFVQSVTVGTLFHTSRWLECFSGRPTILVARDTRGEILGGLALLKTQRRGFSGFFPPPFTPYYGLVYQDKYDESPMRHFDEYNRLIGALLSRLDPWMSLDLHFHPSTTNLQPFIWSGFSFSLAYTFELPAREAGFESGLFPDRRKKLRGLRREEDAGKIRVEQPGDHAEFLNLARETARTRGFTVDLGVLRTILTGLSGAYILVVARDSGGTATQASFLPYDTRRGYLLVSGSRTVDGDPRGNAQLLLIAHLARFCEQRQLVFDFEGSIVPRIAEYNRRFGVEMRPYWRAQKFRSSLQYAARAARQYATKDAKSTAKRVAL